MPIQADCHAKERFSVRIYTEEELSAMPKETLLQIVLNQQKTSSDFAARVSETNSQCESLFGRCKALEAENRKLRSENRELRGQLFGGNKTRTLGNIVPGAAEGMQGDPEGHDNPPESAESRKQSSEDSVADGSDDVSVEEKPASEASMTDERKTELEKQYQEFSKKAKEIRKELNELHPEEEKQKPLRGFNTDAFMDNLPRVYVDVPVSAEDLLAVFDGDYREFGKPNEVEELVIEPARVYVLVHRVPRFAGLRNGENSVYEPAFAIDNKLLPGSICSTSLLGYILNRKYSEGMPVTRMLGSSELMGVELTKQRVYGWIHFAACLFAPLVFRALQVILSKEMIQIDETYTIALINGLRTTGYYWVIRTGAYETETPMAVMVFAPSRAEYVLEMIFGWMEDIHFSIGTDGHSAYKNLCNEHPDMIEAHGECWAHARGKIVDALNDIPGKDTMTEEQLLNLPAYQLLLFIALLFTIDMPLKDVSPEERLAVRNEQSRPVVDDFFRLIHLLHSDRKIDSGSKLGIAINYCVNQEAELRAFLRCGDIPLSNNASEQLMIWLAMGRCGWKMSSSLKGAMDNAVCYSICYLAKLAGVDTAFYFQYLLRELPAALRKLGMQQGCEYDTFLDTFVMEHMRKGADSDLPPAMRRKLREEAMDKEKARERMKKKFRQANIPDNLSDLDRLFPFSPEIKEAERIYMEQKGNEFREKTDASA